MAVVYKITYPNGKIYVGQDRLHTLADRSSPLVERPGPSGDTRPRGPGTPMASSPDLGSQVHDLNATTSGCVRGGPDLTPYPLRLAIIASIALMNGSSYWP